MKFALVLTQWSRGGAEKVALTFAHEMVSRNYDVLLLCLSSNNRVNYSINSNVEFLVIREKTLIQKLCACRKAIRNYRPDVIWSHGTYASFWTYFFRIKQAKWVASEHNIYEFDFALMRNKFVKLYVYRCVDLLTCLVNEDMNKYEHIINKHLLLNPVEPLDDTFKKDESNAREMKILFIGNYQRKKDKGYDRLIEFSKNLERRKIKHIIHCFGGGLEGVISPSENIEYMGFVEDIYSVIGKYDVLLNVSRVEGLPVSILEAFSANVSVFVNSDVPGNKFLIGNSNERGGGASCANLESFTDEFEKFVMNQNIQKIRLAKAFADNLSPSNQLNRVLGWLEL